MRLEYQGIVAALLSCLSVGSFLQLGQLLIPIAGPFVPAFLGLYAAASMFFAIRSAYRERTRDRFDLTAPTVFGNGVLVLRSQGDKCAAFLALAFRPKDVRPERARRTLTTLLKVLPHSSVFSLEITRQDECFASFYVKLQRSDVLQRTRELLASVLSGFKALFGDSAVRALCDDELQRHLALGAPGRIQRVARSGRYAALLITDTAKRWLSAETASNVQPDLLQTTDTESNGRSLTCRVIFALKNEEQLGLVAGPKLVVTTASDRPQSNESLPPLRATGVRRMRASEITRRLGDIMTRSVFANDKIHESFEKGVDELLSFLALRCVRQPDTRSPCSQTVYPAVTDAGEWRRTLFATAEELELKFEADVLVWTTGFPLRVDARVEATLFKIVPDCRGDQARLQWLLDELAPVISSGTASSMALLLSNVSDASVLTEILAKMPARDAIRPLTSVVQLQALLKQCRGASERTTQPPAEAVQKIL